MSAISYYCGVQSEDRTCDTNCGSFNHHCKQCSSAFDVLPDGVLGEIATLLPQREFEIFSTLSPTMELVFETRLAPIRDAMFLQAWHRDVNVVKTKFKNSRLIVPLAAAPTILTTIATKRIVEGLFGNTIGIYAGFSIPLGSYTTTRDDDIQVCIKGFLLCLLIGTFASLYYPFEEGSKINDKEAIALSIGFFAWGTLTDHLMNFSKKCGLSDLYLMRGIVCGIVLSILFLPIDFYIPK